jgi:hypothetical protein
MSSFRLALVLVAAMLALFSPARAEGWSACADRDEVTVESVRESRDVCRYADRFLVLSPAFISLIDFNRSGADQRRYGAGLELALVSWRHPSRYSGASHGEITAGFAVVGNGADDVAKRALYDVGFRASFERNVGRAWLIPFWGLRAGKSRSYGRDDAEDANRAFAMPSAGFHLFWWAGREHNLFEVTLDVGLQVSVSDPWDWPMRARAAISLSRW